MALREISGLTPHRSGWRAERKAKAEYKAERRGEQTTRGEPAAGGEWQDPAPWLPSVPAAEPFPVQALPRAVANFVLDEADRMQAPADLLAIPR